MYALAFPGARLLIARDTGPNLRDTTQKTFFDWFPDGVAGHWEKSTNTFWLSTGPDTAPGEILFRGLDDESDIQRVLSLDLGGAFLDEPQGGIALRGERGVVHEPGINRKLFLALLARCGRQTGYPKMLWMGGNPPAPEHWIAKEFEYDPGASGCDPPKNPRRDRHLYLGDQETNRHNLPPRYYEDSERDFGVDTPMARRFLRGLWIPFAALKPFHASWVRYAGKDGEPECPERQHLVIRLGVDPASSTKDTAAWTGLVVAGQSRQPDMTHGRIFVLEAVKGHWTPRQQAERIVKLVERWGVRTVAIEDVAYQRSLGDILDMVARESGVVVHVELVRPDADKLRRANAWSGLVEGAQVLFGAGQQALIQAMLAVPEDPSEWDLVDAGGICIRGFQKLGPAQSILPGHDPSTTERARGYAVRSYREEAAPPPLPRPRLSTQNPSTPKRAIGYAVRRQHGERGATTVRR